MIDTKASPAKADCSLKCDTTNISTPASFVSDNVESCSATATTKTLDALVCKTGFIPYSDFLKCVASSTISGCKIIDGAAPAKCKTCNAGYVISSTGTCIPCSSDSSFNVDKYASCT